MKLRVATLAAFGLIFSVAANAEEIKTPHEGDYGVFSPAGGCDTADDKAYTGDSGVIPDADPGGLTLGPVMTPADGSTFDSVELSVDMFHTWIGDLQVSLYYDMGCDGSYEVGPMSALCRPGLDFCELDGCCGCGDDIDGSYLFSDDGAVSMEAACGPGFLEGGCYAMDPDSANPMAVLDGVMKGGCFWLFVADGAAGDTGSVNSWSVYSANGGGGTPIEEASWSEVKSSF